MMFAFRYTKLINNIHNGDKRCTVKLYNILMTTLVIFSILIISCNNPSGETPDTNASTSDSALNNPDIASPANVSNQPVKIPTDLTGNIKIDGSSTVFPITEAVAEEFGYLTGGT